MFRFRLSYLHERLLILVSTGLLLFLIALGPSSATISSLRLILTIFFLLVLPGYILQTALFPAREALDALERLALSLVVSLAIIPPIALLLDMLPGVGIRLETILTGELLVMILSLIAADYRRNQLADEQQYRLEVTVAAGDWWQQRTTFQRVTYSLFGGLVLLAVVAALAIATIPGSAEHFTEFYLLDADHLVETFPREVIAGQDIPLTVGITSHEAAIQNYRLEITIGERLLISEMITLAPDKTSEHPVQFKLEEIGDNQQVNFTLYHEGEPDATSAYRTLHLWFDVKHPPS